MTEQPQLSRRGFLGGLLGALVVVALPKIPSPVEAAEDYDLFAVEAPKGTTYQWVRTHVQGVEDLENLQKRIANGWTFVKPSAHPKAPAGTLSYAIDHHGLVLMERPTADVQAAERQRRIEGPCAKGNHAFMQRNNEGQLVCHWCGVTQASRRFDLGSFEIDGPDDWANPRRVG